MLAYPQTTFGAERLPRGPRIIIATTAGFTLIELIIVTAVIAILSTIAVPSFIAYRDRTRVVQVVGSSEAIRAALASYAAGSPDNLYPPTGAISNFNDLRLVVNANGGMLPISAIFAVSHYSLYDSDGDSMADTYSMRLNVQGVPSDIPGAQLLITPQGIFRCSATGNPC
jgi:prepilin-type N-terminal cleavage/methylation domain-containing protein